MTRSVYKVLPAAALAAMVAWPALGDDNIVFGGFIRQEIAPTLTGDKNPNNTGNNPFNGKPQNEPWLYGPPNVIGTRNIANSDSVINWMATRVEFDTQAKLNENLKAYVKLRAIYEPELGDQPVKVNMFKTKYYGNNATPLEFDTNNTMVDLPAAYLDFAQGPVWLRAGNQQIAWGESLFFRALDLPNGLDLRRHLIFEPVAEEYSDKRVPMPGLRGSYRFSDAVELEGFGQMFNPSILPTTNSPYNLIPSQFTVYDKLGAARSTFNGGARLQAHIGDLALQFLYVNRHNPDGVFRWTASGVNKDLPGLTGTGAILAQTPFSVDQTGVCSAQEWFKYAGDVRLNGITGVGSAVTGPFAAAQLLGAFAPTTYSAAESELNTFFHLAGGCMRGFLNRSYPVEQTFGSGASYVIDDEPGSLLDQLIVRAELTYTPRKTFTNPSLGVPITKGEVVGTLNFEKWQRFSQDFPATYMVLQYLAKSQSDLFGRYLGGFGGSQTAVGKGIDSFHAMAFAVQQPFPNLIWRADLSILADMQGGVFIQPNLRWKPDADWQVDGYMNLFKSANNNKNIIDTINWADEVGIRFTRQF